MPGTLASQPSMTENGSDYLDEDRDEALAAAPSADFGAHVVMFWLLVVMAALVSTPCVLIPIWLETEDLVRAEAGVAANTAKLDARIAEQRRVMAAFTSDPLVNERIARRDLRFRRAGEEVQSVENDAAIEQPIVVPDLPAEPNATPAAAVEPPEVVNLARRWLPNLPWVELFGRSPNRGIFLVMAGGLLMAAFVLYGHVEPRSSTSRRPTAE